jgi:hypothetical protein
MYCRVTENSAQASVIEAKLPLPWQGNRPIAINFDLWQQLSRGQRDLLFLRTVCWLTQVKWLRIDLYSGMAAAGLIGTLVELSQADAIGAVVAGGLTALASTQIWRSHNSTRRELEADELGIQVAQRRGYSQTDAARSLLEAIETVAQLEQRSGLDFVELLRCQNLKAIAGLSNVSIPETLRKQ